ncbi:MAG TPA: VOC family protein [Chloroflexota bacterium]|jgi:catechol 2,3-dioxygenase-like lactoylglutathione lyase family enzyme
MAVVNVQLFQHVGIPVSDLELSKKFYTEVLGLNVTKESGGWNSDAPVRLHVGPSPDCGQQVVLFKRRKPAERREPEDDGDSHHAFVVTPAEFDSAMEKFKEMGCFHRGPITWPTSEHRTLYFFDPDGNYLQLSDSPDD